MAGNEQLEVRADGDVVVLEPRGHVDAEAVRHLVELAEVAAADARFVQVDLGGVSSLSEEGADVLLFRCGRWARLPEGTVLRTNGRSARQAVIRAYAGRRSGGPPPA